MSLSVAQFRLHCFPPEIALTTDVYKHQGFSGKHRFLPIVVVRSLFCFKCAHYNLSYCCLLASDSSLLKYGLSLPWRLFEFLVIQEDCSDPSLTTVLSTQGKTVYYIF